ncbi:MAG: RagB/SusD family nutrient uptake outer membrane protein [Saprospiraceae bacterium]|nr:RagB/SusD family nutrient uptake outer membrane protein [Saprospiraceae bacterium]
MSILGRGPFYLFLAVVFISLRCEKALEETPKSLLTNKVFYTTASDALLAVNAAYDHLGSGTSNSDFGGVYFNNFWVIQALASDEGEAGRSDPNTVQLDEFRHDASNLMVQDVWEDTYKTINLANIAIKNIPDIDMDEGLKNRLMGEVFFIRGMMYFDLVRMFGDVPLRLLPTEDLSILTAERTGAEEVYAQVITDLQAAETRLPVSYTGADLGRATTGAASGYLAKVFLTRKEWPAAMQHAEKVMASGNYQLLDDYADIFKIANSNSREVVFSINFTFNNNAIWETSQFNVRTLPLALNRNSNSWEVPTADVYAAFDPMDRRREVTFATSFTESDGTVINFTPHIFKYWDQKAEPSASSSGSDFFNLRYADILLMYAEAANEVANGPTAEAYEALNRVRRRARFAEGVERQVLPELSDLNMQAFREAVWLERRRELVWEGHRWFELVRQNRLKSRVEAAKPGVTVDESKYVLFGIPQRERDINPNLSQNPGY